jgi:hypothetical protein
MLLYNLMAGLFCGIGADLQPDFTTFPHYHPNYWRLISFRCAPTPLFESSLAGFSILLFDPLLTTGDIYLIRLAYP